MEPNEIHTGGWRGLLEEGPSRNPYGLDNLTLVGHFNFNQKLKEKKRGPHPEVLQLVKKHYVDYPLDGYGYSKPTHEKIRTEALLMDRASPVTVNEDALEFARRVMSTFTRKISYCRLATPSEVYENLEPTSLGPYYGNILPGKATKLDLAPMALYHARRMLEMEPSDFEKHEFLFEVRGKTEILSRTKIEAHRNRIFRLAPFDLFCLEAMFTADFDRQFKELETGYAQTLEHGGLQRMFWSMDQRDIIISNDKKGYDQSQQNVWHREFARAINYVLDATPKQKEIHSMLRSKHTTCFMLFPNGEVYRTKWSHGSGCFATTLLNCWTHRFQQAVVYWLASNKLGKLGLSDNYLANRFLEIDMNIAGDDFIAALDDIPSNAIYVNTDNHVSLFAEIGITVKPESHRVSGSTEHHVYLGWGITDGKPTHSREDKIIASLLYGSKEYREDTIMGAQANAPFNPKLSKFIEELAITWKVNWPGVRWSQQLWTRQFHSFVRSTVFCSAAPHGGVQLESHENIPQYLITSNENMTTKKNKNNTRVNAQKQQRAQVKKDVQRDVRKELSKRSNYPSPQLLRNARVSNKLSAETYRYLQAVIDPYNTPSGVCSPDKTSRKSLRTRLMAKGSLSTGQGHVGYITCSPHTVPWSDTNSVQFTTNAYTGTTIDKSAVGCTSVAFNAPYSTSTGAAADVRARVVALGIRILNTSTNYNMGGSVIGFFNPDETMQGYTIDQIGAFEQCHFMRPTASNWIHLEWAPVDDPDFEFEVMGGASSLVEPYMAIMIATPGVTTQSYVWEAYAHVEYTGSIPGLQDGNCDPLGQAAVLNVLSDCDGSASDKWITKVPKLSRKAVKLVSEMTGTAATLAAAAGMLA